MSRKLLAILVSELKTIRIVCCNKDCGAVTEMSLEKAASRSWGSCPTCNHDFGDGSRDGSAPIGKLAKLLNSMQQHTDKFDVEFSLEVKE